MQLVTNHEVLIELVLQIDVPGVKPFVISYYTDYFELGCSIVN